MVLEAASPGASSVRRVLCDAGGRRPLQERLVAASGRRGCERVRRQCGGHRGGGMGPQTGDLSCVSSAGDSVFSVLEF